MAARFLLIGTLPLCLIPAGNVAQAQNAPGASEVFRGSIVSYASDVKFDLLGVPGASRTVLEVRVPYAETSLIDLIGPLPAGAVSQPTAEAMAAACLARARQLAPDVAAARLIGVAATAALVSDRPKKGAHRAHLAVAHAGGRIDHQLVELGKGRSDRAGEDRVVSDAILVMIAAACGLTLPDGASGIDPSPQR